MIAYHFTGATLRDGRPVPEIGETLIHDGPVEICKTGLHASIRPAHALEYAPGAMLHRVECAGIVAQQDDKLVCRSRTIIASIDATQLLRRFAAGQALSVAHLWDMPATVRNYLETLDDSKRAAARAAAWDAAWDAARDAARAAARAAAWDATWDAARAAAWAAARAAAWDATWDAARAAARAAAWGAAWGAAWDEFDRRVYAAFGVGQ